MCTNLKCVEIIDRNTVLVYMIVAIARTHKKTYTILNFVREIFSTGVAISQIVCYYSHIESG